MGLVEYNGNLLEFFIVQYYNEKLAPLYTTLEQNKTAFMLEM